MTAQLMALDDLVEKNKATEEQRIIAELMAILIEKYEEEHYSLEHIKAQSTPAERLAGLMAERGMTQTDLANLLNSRSLASEILSGRRNMSKSQIVKFAEHFQVPAETFTMGTMAPYAFIPAPRDEKEALDRLRRWRKTPKLLGPNLYEVDGEVVSLRRLVKMAERLPPRA